MEFNWNFQRSSGFSQKIPSMWDVRIFYATVNVILGRFSSLTHEEDCMIAGNPSDKLKRECPSTHYYYTIQINGKKLTNSLGNRKHSYLKSKSY